MDISKIYYTHQNISHVTLGKAWGQQSDEGSKNDQNVMYMYKSDKMKPINLYNQ